MRALIFIVYNSQPRNHFRSSQRDVFLAGSFCALFYGGKPRKSLRTLDIAAEIRAEHLPNTRLEHWHWTHLFRKSRNSSVGIATGYGLDGRGVRVRVPVGSRIFTSSCLSDRLWSPPSLLSSGHLGLFPRG
jgi:hypothetical protein